MERKVAVTVIVAVVILFFSLFAVTVQGETVYPPFAAQDTTQQFALSTPLVLGISFQEKAGCLNQTTRAEIFGLIQDNPGLHFRGVCDSLGLSIGMVQYHLGVLVSAGLVTAYSDGKMQRFFEAGKYTPKKMKIISLLRHKTSGAILKILNDKKVVTHSELAAQLSITSQGLTWQMNRLKKEGVIQETSNGLKLSYAINDANASSVAELVYLVNPRGC